MKNIRQKLKLMVPLVLATFIGLSAALQAKPKEDILSSYRLAMPTKDVLDRIGQRYEIGHREGNTFVIYVPLVEADRFLAIAPTATLLREDIHTEFEEMEARDSHIFAGYPSYTEIESHLRAIAEAHSDIARLITYGTSAAGRPLFALKLSDHVAASEDGEPQLLVTAATHGDEIVTTAVLLSLIDEMVAGYGKNPMLTRFIDSTATMFVPVLNADGYVNRDRYEGNKDPNRSYPYPDAPNKSIPAGCVASIVQLTQQIHFDGSLDLHAYGRMIMHPWGYTTNSLPSASDDTMFDRLTTAMSEQNNYAHGQIAKVIYVARGSSADYYYWKYGTTAVVAEVGDYKAPAMGDIPGVTNQVRPALWEFMDHFSKAATK